MTSMHDHTPLDAVDALFELRAQMARLREREAELCDEIRSFATENGGEKVIGATRVAVIETRMPVRVDPAKLPHAILSDPHFFASEEETVVLLWPRPAVAQAAMSETVVLHEPDCETLEEINLTVEDAPQPVSMLEESDTQPSQEVETTAEDTEVFAGLDAPEDAIEAVDFEEAPLPSMDSSVEGVMADETEKFERPAHEEAFASDAISLDVAEQGSIERPPAASPMEVRTIGVPVEEKDDPFTEMYDLETPALAASEDTAAVDLASPEPEGTPEAFVNADDPFGLKAASSQEAVMAADMPLIDAHDAVEGETPKDLRPTEHAHLQPLAGLPDEDVAQMIHDSEDMLAPATLPDALDTAQALETQADQLADLSADVALGPLTPPPTDFEDSDVMPATAFSSRRIAVGGET
ncbi:hypothetical protein [uncultured Celeribacter sp.]|uniref:hypothetical protein n=1 Tax=uncultured Celeribacter sp. TaxID=1303376 RepID=UPI002AA68853|nr:hypothetical protein [uncultured Celeribacter sp.]